MHDEKDELIRELRKCADYDGNFITNEQAEDIAEYISNAHIDWHKEDLQSFVLDCLYEDEATDSWVYDDCDEEIGYNPYIGCYDFDC